MLELLKAGKAVYDTVNKAAVKATWDKDWLKKVVNTVKEKAKSYAAEQKKKSESTTFDLSQVKSTVTNPSKMFKWISVEDEQKILKIASEMYPWWSGFEKQQAIQWLYNAALDSQKQKDIDAGRQEIKIDLINKEKNAKSTKEKNTYKSQRKKADLADLIKDQLEKQWYNRSQFMNVTDDWIIAWFLETNPEYKDTFNKYFYNNDDAVQLWKDLWWIEKTRGDKVNDKINEIWEWMAGWLPKWGEWVKDLLDRWLAWTDQNVSREKNIDNAAFDRFVQEKYWTYPWALTDKDYAQAKKDFNESNKKEYTPTWTSAWTKMAMWATDIALTAWWIKGASLLRNNLFKLWFSTLSADDNMSRSTEALWDALSFVWSNINKLPWFSSIRDSLQTEQEKADWDAFVAWNVLSLVRSWKRNFNQIKDADVQWWKQSFDKVKQWQIQEWVNTLKENAKENRAAKMNEKKLEAAQTVSQWQIETRQQAANALDNLNEQWKLSTKQTWIKRLFKKNREVNIDELEKITDEEVNRLKEEQTKIAQSEQKKFWQSELWVTEDVEVLNEAWEKAIQKQMAYPLWELLDNIIEHYEEVDKSQATKYKSYKRALNNWKLPAETILEIRREWNSLNQNVYNSKTNLVKDTNKSQKWATNMKKVNKVIEWLDIWEDLRQMDSKLSSLYTLQSWIKEIKKSAANLEKKTIKWWGAAKWLGKTTSRVLGKLSFGATNFLSKALVSMIQEGFWWWAFEKTTYNAAEVARNVPKFIKEYKNLITKIEWWTVPKNNAVRLINAFIDKWQLEQQFNDADQD